VTYQSLGLIVVACCPLAGFVMMVQHELATQRNPQWREHWLLTRWMWGCFIAHLVTFAGLNVVMALHPVLRLLRNPNDPYWVFFGLFAGLTIMFLMAAGYLFFRMRARA
jgi:hypothetical protein